ncbi:MAG: hypothetical protein EAX96_12880 [Candidatus Lokiarchaeota archaeon]|nr:hypothetical protein [Candidatus Lokiarchaeota archaeon]
MGNENRHILASLLCVFGLICTLTFGNMLNFMLTPQKSNNIIGISSNSYIENSNFNNITYSVAFTSGDLVIHNSLKPSAGSLNGYNVINSTVINNSTSIETKLGYVCLYGNVKLTLNNISNKDLTIVCLGNSILNIQNSNIKSIYIFEHSRANINNSSVSYVLDRFQALNQTMKSYSSQNVYLSIKNNSIVNEIELVQGGNLEIDNSTIVKLLLGSSSPTTYTYISMFGKREISGIVLNSVISDAKIGGISSLNCIQSNISSISTFDLGRLILNQSKIDLLSKSIIVYGDISIDNGTISGSNFINTTEIINSTVTSCQLGAVTVNNSANVEINNTLCQLTLYNQANVTFSNVTLSTGFLLHELYDSSFLTVKKTAANALNYLTINSFNQSSVNVLLNSSGINLLVASSGDTYAFNSSINTLQPLGRLVDLSINNITLINCSISNAICLGSSTIHIENCSISNLNEGIYCTSGKLTWNLSGITGSGIYFNKTTLINNIILNRTIYSVETNGSTELNIEDLENEFELIAIDYARVTLENSTFNKIKASNYAKITIINSTNIGIDPLILAMEHAEIIIKDNSIVLNLKVLGSARILTDFSNLKFVDLFDEASLVLNNVISSIVQVSSKTTSDYAFKAYKSKITKLNAISLGPS